MAIINTGQTFTPTDTVTNTKLQDIADAATFNDPADETSLELITGGANAGKLGVKDAGITPAKLSTGAPEWDATGALLTDNVTAPESANSLLLRSDPETPGSGADGGSQIRLFSSDSAFADQIFYRGDFHTFNNIAGDVQGSIPYGAVPSQPQHFVRKDYVDGGGGFTPSTYAGEESVTLPNGLIMKFGTVTAGTSGTSVSFASAFPTAAIWASACPNSSANLTQSTGYSGKASVDSLSTSGVNVSCDGSAYWQAIGY